MVMSAEALLDVNRDPGVVMLFGSPPGFSWKIHPFPAGNFWIYGGEHTPMDRARSGGCKSTDYRDNEMEPVGDNFIRRKF
ncbi:MAG: hypothetical protein LBF74_11195, partial [Treponema sp.]|nr:hypothetical protein [Treponema sp.]